MEAQASNMSDNNNNSSGCFVSIIGMVVLALVSMAFALIDKGEEIENLNNENDSLREEIAMRDTFVYELLKVEY